VIPPIPDVPDEQRGRSELKLRYEDITPDGRLSTSLMPQALGVGFWQTLAPQFGIGEARRETGIVPILSRLVAAGGEGPVGLLAPVRIEACFRLARVERRGAVRRILLEVWAELFAPRARVHGAPPPGAGEEIAVGRVYAEHVFTRLFAPPEQRRVTRLEHDRLPAVPPEVVPWSGPDALLELPEGTAPLDETLVPDEAPVVFGLDHCDSNQHVNSLVYPRLFRDAALRHLTIHHGDVVGEGALLTRLQDTAFRKPCFVGERMRVVLRGYRRSATGALGVVAVLVEDEAASAQPLPRGHGFARVELQTA